MDDSQIQPGAHPTPPADNQPPATPPEPATPPADATPPTPELPPENQQLTPEEQLLKKEDDEWDAAANELFPGIKSVNKDKPNEPAKPTENDQTSQTTQAPADGQKPDAQPKDGNDSGQQGADTGAAGDKPQDGDGGEEDEESELDTAALDARRESRAYQQQVAAVKSDVRAKLFPNQTTELKDADGDPIRSIDDVMRLINPRTQKNFTEEEAGQWFLAAQQQLNQNTARTDKEIDRIAEVNMDLKDQADSINYRYGNLLKEMPELRDRIWAAYQKTLVKDEKTGIITNAPVALEDFYEVQLEPYAQVGRQAAADQNAAAAKAAADAKAAAEAKAAEEAKKQQSRQDRSDIYGGGKTNEQTPEDKEWADAMTAVFGPKQ